MTSYLALSSNDFPAWLSVLRWSHCPQKSLQIFVMSWLAHFNPVFLLPMCVKYFFCVSARDVVRRPKIIDVQPIRRMSEYRVRFGHCGRSFIFPAIYQSVLAQRIAISGSMFQSSSNLRNASTDAVHLSIYHGFPHEYIGTDAVSSLELCHSTGKGWLLHVLVAIGFYYLSRCYSCILW